MLALVELFLLQPREYLAIDLGGKEIQGKQRNDDWTSNAFPGLAT